MGDHNCFASAGVWNDAEEEHLIQSELVVARSGGYGCWRRLFIKRDVADQIISNSIFYSIRSCLAEAVQSSVRRNFDGTKFLLGDRRLKENLGG